MRTRNVVATVVALVMIMCASAARVAAAQGTGLPGEVTSGEWTLVSLQSAPGKVQDTANKGITIQLDTNGTASGSGGCNRFTGGFTAGPGQQLKFGEFASTLMACETDIATREAEYLAALKSVTTYALDGSGKLQLTFDNGQGILSYVRAQPTSMPNTGAASDTVALLGLAGLLCCVAGFWVSRRRISP